MIRRISRATGLALVLALALVGTAVAAVTFGSQNAVPGAYTWNYSNSLESTGTGGTFKLHSAFVSDNTLPQSVYYTNSADGVSWSAPTVLTGATVHGEGSSVATAGNTVIVGWVTWASYNAYDPADPKVFQVRVSTNGGGTWGAVKSLTSATGRADYPIVAAAKTSAGPVNLYGVYTDSDTGKVKFRVKSGANAWSAPITLGSTAADALDGEGKFAYANVGATGDLVSVAWISDNLGTVKTRSINLNGVSTSASLIGNWNPIATLTGKMPPATNGYPIVGANPLDTGRVAIGWNTTTQIKVATFDGTTTNAAGTVVYTKAVPYNGTNTGYSVTPEPAPGGGMIVSWGACRATSAANDCNYAVTQARVDYVASTSADSVTFSAPQVVASSGVNTQKLNDGGSALYDGTKTYLMYNGWTSNYGSYDLFTKVGTGSL